MNKNYKLNQRVIACIFLVSLFLQSCDSPTTENKTTSTSMISNTTTTSTKGKRKRTTNNTRQSEFNKKRIEEGIPKEKLMKKSRKSAGISTTKYEDEQEEEIDTPQMSNTPIDDIKPTDPNKKEKIEKECDENEGEVTDTKSNITSRYVIKVLKKNGFRFNKEKSKNGHGDVYEHEDDRRTTVGRHYKNDIIPVGTLKDIEEQTKINF